MISVIDYGAGNLRSVANTLDATGAEYELATNPAALRAASKIILPGVGHFGQMMHALDSLDMRDVLIYRIRSGVPFLGICLGMQALFEGSEEAPDLPGLGIFAGKAVRFPLTARVPHMGWNQVSICQGSRLFQPFTTDPWFYFAHSYYLPKCSISSGLCSYSLTYSAAIEKENIFGVQFHPEKSSSAGQLIVQRFLNLPVDLS